MLVQKNKSTKKDFCLSIDWNFWILPSLIIVCILLFTSACSEKEQILESDTVTDIDGNVYPTVKIGSQTWMAENLKATKFNDGTIIDIAAEAWKWEYYFDISKPAYCHYENDFTSNRNIYGTLYNYYTITSGKLCPKGWHIPAQDEWKYLIDWLGGENVAGCKLKEVDTIHGHSPNVGADNSSGFTARPAGRRSDDGIFINLRYHGFWWVYSANAH